MACYEMYLSGYIFIKQSGSSLDTSGELYHQDSDKFYIFYHRILICTIIFHTPRVGNYISEGSVSISICNEHNYALIQQFEEFT